MKEIETCADNPKCHDCIYRRTIGSDVPICFYAVLMQECRGCKISECDKYKTGTKQARSKIEYMEWEMYYDDDYI